MTGSGHSLPRMAGSVAGYVGGALKAFKRAYYEAAEINRTTKNRRATRRLHPNVPVARDGAWVRAQLRQLRRDNPILAGAVLSFKTNVLPTPILIEPDVKRAGQFKPSGAMNRNWNDPVNALWKLWCGGPCDFNGWASHADTFATLQQKLAAPALMLDGTAFVVKRRRSIMPGVLPDFQIELKTLDQLDDSRSFVSRGALLDGQVPGIEYDAQGRPVAYWFRRLGAGFSVGEAERVPAEDVIHVMVPSEPGEQLGEMLAAPALNPLQWLHEAVTSEFSIRAIMSRIGGVITGSDSLGAVDDTDGNGDPYRLLDLETATILNLGDGEFREWNMQRPGAQWQQLVEQFLRWISAGLRIPYSILASDFRGLNYSVSRMERLAEQPFLDLWRRDIIAGQFVSKVYEAFVRECVVQGFLALPGTLTVADVLAHRIRLPRTAYIDPLKDAQADLARMRQGESPQRVFGERGLDFYEEMEATNEAKEFAEGLGLHHLTIFAPEPGSTSAAITQQIAKDEADAAMPAVPPDERKHHVA